MRLARVRVVSELTPPGPEDLLRQPTTRGGPNQHVNVTFVAASVTPLILAYRNRTPRRQNVATATNLVTLVMFATLSLGTLLDIRNIQVTHVSLTTNIPPVAAQPLQVEVR